MNYSLLSILFFYRYGINFTIGLAYNRRWRYIFPCVLCQVISQIFGVPVYAITSNAGEIALLIGITFILFLIQKDLALAGSFADFLHRSNVAFQPRMPRLSIRRESSYVVNTEQKVDDKYMKAKANEIELTEL